MTVTMETEQTDVPPFELKNSRLGNRCKDVFGCLDDLELKHQAFERTRAIEDAEEDEKLVRQGPSQAEMETISPAFKPPASRGRQYQNRQGGRHSHERTSSHTDFKQPGPRDVPTRGRRPFRRGQGRGWQTPDYKLHPERWTEYSLEDVDISDSSNKQAAFDFLQERRAMRDSEMKEDSVDLDNSACSKGLITFKKPVKKSTKSETVSSGTRQKAMESNDLNETEDNDVIMEDSQENIKESSKNLKRKVETLEDEEMTSSDTNVSVGFKSRKVARKNIRCRQRQDDDSD